MIKSCNFLRYKSSQIAAAAFSLAVEYNNRKLLTDRRRETNYDIMGIWNAEVQECLGMKVK